MRGRSCRGRDPQRIVARPSLQMETRSSPIAITHLNMKYWPNILVETQRQKYGKSNLHKNSIILFHQAIRVNPSSLSYPFPLLLPVSFARSRESKGCPNSGFDRGVGVRGRGR